MPEVSIVIPCFNQAAYLSDALESLSSQTLYDWECLIVNDGSTDETSSVANAWCSKDNRFKYIYKENGGLSSARNLGINLSKGKQIQFLDADDILLPEKLEIGHAALVRAKDQSVYLCDYGRGRDDNVYELDSCASYLPPTFKNFLSLAILIADWETRISIPAHCFMFTRDFFDAGVRFDTSLKNHEDWRCWCEIFRRAKNIFYDKRKLVIYRNTAASMSKSLGQMQEGFTQALDQLISDRSLAPELLALLRAKRGEITFLYEYRKLAKLLENLGGGNTQVRG